MRLRGRLLRWPVAAATVVVLAGGGTAYAVGRGDGGPDYRTATATRGDVEETLTTSGLVDAADRADLSFGIDGRAASVRVGIGDTVKAGDVIATLDPAELDAAVTEAKASLAQAVAQLAADQEAQASAVQDASDQLTDPQNDQSTDQPDGQQDGDSGDKPDDDSAALLAKLREQQKAVLEAQSAASAVLAEAKSALAAQTEACADAYGSATPSASTETQTPEAATEEPDPENAACDAALAEVQARQTVVKEAQDTLAEALDALTATLSKALGSLGDSQPQGASARTAAADDLTSPTDDADGGIDGDDKSNGETDGTTVTAARLAADQAQIDQAKADLVVAKAERAQATLRATRSGRVVALDLAKGDEVSAGTTVATVVGGNAVTLTATVPETSVDQVKAGQSVRVSVPGQSKTTAGTVTAVGLVADTSTGSTSYPVTVSVEDPEIALPTGSRAQLAIVLDTAKGVVTLPTSAVSGTVEDARVRVWDGKKVSTERVKIGAVGDRSVEITDGVEAGAKVVLADVDEAISGASDELNERGGFGPGNAPVMEFRNPGGGGGGPVTFMSPGK